MYTLVNKLKKTNWISESWLDWKQYVKDTLAEMKNQIAYEKNM